MRPDHAELDDVVRTLAGWPRPSASEGERRAAEWIAERLRRHGLPAAVEEERAHGSYWWPLGLLCALTALGGRLGLRGHRVAAALLGALGCAGIREELEVRGGRWTRRALPKRSTWNVVARAGEADAPRTIVLGAHHDAAHAGLVFRPGGGSAPPVQWVMSRLNASPPLMWLVMLSPVLVLLGALSGRRGLLRAGMLNALGSGAIFADIGARSVVAGANDNLSAVAVVLAVGRALAERPVAGATVLLVSTGSEESFEEGMVGFAARHAGELDPSRTTMIVADTVGSPQLLLLEGEGMLVPKAYDSDLKDLLARCAEREGVDLRRGHWLTFGSDALIALRRGIPCALLGSYDHTRLPSNYHWYSDVPDNLDLSTVADAAVLCEAAIRELAAQADSSRA